MPGFDHRFHWSFVPMPVVLLGDLLVVLGFAIIFIVFKENSYSAGTIKVEPNQPVIATGPYAWVRHPMYSGGSLMLLASSIGLGSYWALIPALLAMAVIVVRLLDEERFLTINLPGYKDYCHKVKSRLIPFVW